MTVISDLIKEVRPFSRRGLLERIANVAATLDKEPRRIQMLKWPKVVRGTRLRDIDVLLATHNLEALTKLVLAHGNKWSNKLPEFGDIVRLQNHVENLPSRFTEGPTGTVSIEEMMFQLICQQFPFQSRNEKRALARVHILYKRIPELLEQDGFSLPFDLEEEFQRITGMSLTQFICSGIWLFGLATQSRKFKLGDLENQTEKIRAIWSIPESDLPTQQSMESVLNRVSFELDDFANHIGNLNEHDERLIAYDYQPLLEYPLVHLGNDEYICPIPKLLLDRFTIGVFHDLANAMRCPGRENPFREYFGKLYERYVGLQLSLVFGNSDIHPEVQYERGQKSTSDWTVSHTVTNLAIECRTSTFIIETRKGGDIENITRDLTRIGAETIKDLPPKIESLHAGVTLVALVTPRPTKAVLCTFESLEPIALFGTLLSETAKKIAGDFGEFHLVTIDYLEDMCATEDPSKFMDALAALKVDDTWADISTADPKPAWESAMPEPMRQNTILEEAARYLLDVDVRPA